MDVTQVRNFKDFVLLYNQISETCFRRCISTFLTREITANEDLCLKNCTEKHIHANHKVMEIYTEVQPVLLRKRMEEMTKAQETLETQPQSLQKPEDSV